MHYIIYHDKSVEQVEDKIAEIIWSKSNTMKGAEINGKKYIFSAIAKIREEKDYFKEYPDKRPDTLRDIFGENYGEFNKQIRQPTTQAKELMRKGFIKCRAKMFGESEEEARIKFKDFKLFKI